MAQNSRLTFSVRRIANEPLHLVTMDGENVYIASEYEINTIRNDSGEPVGFEFMFTPADESIDFYNLFLPEGGIIES